MSLPAQPQSAGPGFGTFCVPTPDQFRTEVAWPGDWPKAQAEKTPAGAPDDAEEARMDEEMTDLLDYWILGAALASVRGVGGGLIFIPMLTF